MLTSFVVYAQAPLQKAVEREHASVVSEYSAALNREITTDAKAVAAIEVQQTLTKRTNAIREWPVIRRIEDKARPSPADSLDGPTAERELRRLPTQRLGEPPDQSDVELIAAHVITDSSNDVGAASGGRDSLEQKRVIDPDPTTRAERAAQQRALSNRKREAALSKQRSRQQISDTVSFVLTAALSDRLPVKQETLKTVLESVVETFGKAMQLRVGRAYETKERDAAEEGRPLSDLGLSTRELSALRLRSSVVERLLLPADWPTRVAKASLIAHKHEREPPKVRNDQEKPPEIRRDRLRPGFG